MNRTMQAHAITVRELQIEQAVQIEASPERVFDALTTGIGAWWSHSNSGKPDAMTLEPRPGGRFFEEFGASGGAHFATVQYIKRSEQLRMTGPMGMTTPVLGVVNFSLETQGAATLLALSHHIIGVFDDEVIGIYGGGWQELLDIRLKDFVERGVRYRPE
ncbi:MAG TPA: SRPBCC domain-containing protein [Solirubrobacteraceae bacterium]|nr:SRPBCC domain-containing protein [Solirubrobacteraceae bacterium]